MTEETPAGAQALAPIAESPPLDAPAVVAEPPPVDHLNGEDEAKWDRLCQERIDDTYAKKVTDRARDTEAKNLHEANEYDLSGAGLTDTAGSQLYFKQSKILVTGIVASLIENGFDIKIKADPPPWLEDPKLIQLAQQYAEAFGLPGDDPGAAMGELLTHGESTINEKQHFPMLLQKWLESALVASTGAAYAYTGVSPFSPDVVTKEYVPSDQMWIDIHSTNGLYGAEWHCRFWPATLDQRKARFPEFAEYFDENNPGETQGQSPADAKNSASTFAPGHIQHHLFKNYEMVTAPDGTQKAKYPGFITVVWRYGNKILKIEPLPFLHEESPYDQLIGVTRQDAPDGMSFVLDILYGFVMAENRLINAAIETAEAMGKGKRLLNIDALENPQDAYDNSLSNLLVRPGFNLQEVVYQLVGSDVSPAIRGALDILQSKFPMIVGSAGGNPDAGTQASDATKAGFSHAPLRARLKGFIARMVRKDIFNLIQFDYQNRAFSTNSGFGRSVARFSPAWFAPLIDNMEGYLTVEVTDAKKSNVDPVQQAKITADMIKLAREAIEADPSLPYSMALDMGPDFEGKDRMVRRARIGEAERKKQAEEAKAKGLPDPAQAAAMMRNKVARGEDLSEVVKRNLQDLSGIDPNSAKSVFVALATGGAANLMKIAQEEIPPLTKEEAESVLNLLQLGQTATELKPQPKLGGAPDPTFQTGAPQPKPRPMPQGLPQ